MVHKSNYPKALFHQSENDQIVFSIAGTIGRVFVIKNIPLMNVQVMGTNKDSIKISYNGIDYVKFKDTDFIEEVMENRTKKLTVYGRANLNEWMGKKSVQVFITDYELMEDTSKYDF